MKTSITAGLDDQQKEEVISSFLASATFRERLATILQKKIDANSKEVRSKDAYGIANWAYLQADAVGYERALEEVCSLLK